MKNHVKPDAESRPQELSTPLHTVSGHLQRIDSSDISLFPKPCALEGLVPTRLHINGIKRHTESGIPSESKHALRAIQRPDFRGDHIQCYLPKFIDLDGDPEPRNDQDGNQECDIVVADEDMIYLSKKYCPIPYLFM